MDESFIVWRKNTSSWYFLLGEKLPIYITDLINDQTLNTYWLIGPGWRYTNFLV